MKIYLIRHGQTTGDIENRYGGDYDDKLTEEGEMQAMQLAEKLTNSGIKIVLASPRIRAQQVAKTLSSKFKCEQKTLENLKERNQYGVLTGLVKEEAKEKYPQLVEEVKDYRNQIEGAESYQDFVKRVKKVFTEVTNSAPFSTVAVVTHGGVIRTILREIFNAGEFDIADCGYAVLDVNGQELKIEKLDGIESRTD